MSLERRMKLVELIFTEYANELPNGGQMGPPENWPPFFVRAMAETPPITDLDGKIEYGAQYLQTGAQHRWQGWTS